MVKGNMYKRDKGNVIIVIRSLATCKYLIIKYDVALFYVTQAKIHNHTEIKEIKDEK